MNSYQDNLRSWAIFVRLPRGSYDCVARFRKRSDADASMSLLCRADGEFEVAFDQENTTQESNKQSDTIPTRNSAIG